VEQRSIYESDQDRRQFLTLLERSLTGYQVSLHAYILMTNHFHLLIQTSKANCAEFMRHFNISYTGYYNWRHQRSGNLYQGRYKAFLVDADSYLLEVSRYLHLNCVRVRNLVSKRCEERWDHAVSYGWSSLPGYVQEEQRLKFVSYDLILAMAGGYKGYREFVRDGLRRGIVNPFERVQSRLILGDEDFVTRVRRFLKRGSMRDQPAYREMILNTIEPVQVIGILTKHMRVDPAVLKQRQDHGVIRGMAAELMHKYCDLSQSQIGDLLGGIDYGAVHLLRRRLRKRMLKDPVVRKQWAELEGEVRNACRK
jgi:putative transposase